MGPPDFRLAGPDRGERYKWVKNVRFIVVVARALLVRCEIVRSGRINGGRSDRPNQTISLIPCRRETRSPSQTGTPTRRIHLFPPTAG
jgi:hypothetical protein